MDADVVIVGTGPVGLMLAGELCLAGVRPLVLERQPQLRGTPKASGFNGQIVELLRYRGLLDRVEAASGRPVAPAPGAPFGGVHLDFSHLADPPVRVVHLPQPRLERLLPGTTYPEVNRLAQVTLPDSVTRLDNGDLDVPGLGRIRAGFTRTDRGVFGFGSLTHGDLLIQTTEDDLGISDDAPMTLPEFQDSIRRVLGADLPLEDVTRLSRYGLQARQAERYRDGRILLAGDAAHQFPATGIGINFGMLDAVNLAWKLAAVIAGWAPAGLLDTYHDERHFAGAQALLQTQAQVALRRGQDPAAEALRELFLHLLADEQPLRRLGALIAGTSIRYPMPGPSQHALAGSFAPDLTLHTGQDTTSVAELMHAARPVSSTSPTARISARPPGTGSLASTSIRLAPITGQPMPC
jgi:2-polyprenyl-6-methoxyphenol hydroxylase-like FAD-dependent oxidoreductase